MCMPSGYGLIIQPVFVQGLLEMEFALPTDSTEASGLSLVRRVWVAKFDVEEEAQGLAEKYAKQVTLLHGTFVYIHNLILK